MTFNLLSLTLLLLLGSAQHILNAENPLKSIPQISNSLSDHQNPNSPSEPSKESDVSNLASMVRFLAGIPQGGMYAALEKQPHWETYRQMLNQQWAHITKNRLDPMKVWRDTHLKTMDLPIFYPMGGPDVLNVMTFFPDSSEYILVGLERIGTLTEWKKLQNPNALMRMTNNLRQGLDSLFQRSFFITQDMSRDFYERGVLPTLLVLLARLDNQIDSVRFVTYTCHGQIQDVVENMPPQGVEIVFHKTNTLRLQKLYYFRQNLHNHQIEPFAKFIGARGRFAVMFKSSSYTPHQVGFSKLVQLVKDVGDLVVQDDSGLPYAELNKYWDVELYGMYLKPYGESFQAYHQPHLAKLYQTETNVKPLGFRIGYGYSKAPSSLQVARRQKISQENKQEKPKNEPLVEQNIKIHHESSHFHNKVD